MGKLAQHTIFKLQQGLSGEELADHCRIASDIIIKAAHPNYISGFKDTDAESATLEEKERLLEILMTLLKSTKSVEDRLSIVFALGKSEEVRYQDIYIEIIDGSHSQY